MKRLTVYVLPLLLLLTACGAPADPDTAQESIQVIAMDTAMLISTYGEQSVPAAYAAEDCIRALEAELSRTDPGSEVSRLNAAGGETAEVGEDLYFLLETAKYLSHDTAGAFDITVSPVASAWGFGEDSFRVPSQAELDALLELVDYEQINFNAPPPHSGSSDLPLTACLGPGQSVDLGAIAKGYAADKLVTVFQEHDVPRGLAQLGGNVLAYGDRPDGTPWRVGIQDPAKPDDKNAFAGVLELTDSFAVTSGGYQRYFEENGKRYHHIIDPATGYPADSGLTSVTVVAKAGEGYAGTMCDAFSTALFVMGEETALDFWRTWEGTPFELVLVTEDGRVVVTQGLADRFTLDEASGYAYEAVS
nr:FAD:protein FMN transferase [uncultured Oscillibacter sp.]